MNGDAIEFLKPIANLPALDRVVALQKEIERILNEDRTTSDSNDMLVDKLGPQMLERIREERVKPFKREVRRLQTGPTTENLTLLVGCNSTAEPCLDEYLTRTRAEAGIWATAPAILKLRQQTKSSISPRALRWFPNPELQELAQSTLKTQTYYRLHLAFADDPKLPRIVFETKDTRAANYAEGEALELILRAEASIWKGLAPSWKAVVWLPDEKNGLSGTVDAARLLDALRIKQTFIADGTPAVESEPMAGNDPMAEQRYWNGAGAIHEFSNILLQRPKKLKRLQVKDTGNAAKLLESLQASSYPQGIPQDIVVTSWEDKIIVLERRLPTLEIVPIYRDWQYVQSKMEWKGVRFPQRDREKLYHDKVLQIVLRTVAEVFLATPAAAVDIVSLNGIVHTIDKATGHKIKPCILSIRVNRSKFEALNLDQVDSRECFKYLEGIAGTTLSKYIPVAKLNTYARSKRA